MLPKTLGISVEVRAIWGYQVYVLSTAKVFSTLIAQWKYLNLFPIWDMLESPGKRPRNESVIQNPISVSKVLPGLKTTTTNITPSPFCQASRCGLTGALIQEKKDLTQSVYEWSALNSDKGAWMGTHLPGNLRCF